MEGVREINSWKNPTKMLKDISFESSPGPYTDVRRMVCWCVEEGVRGVGV